MTAANKFRRWVLPSILFVIFGTCIALMITAPTDYRFSDNGADVYISVAKDKDSAKVRIISHTIGNSTKKYPVISATEGETDIIGSFSNGKYRLAKNGNLRLEQGIEIKPQKGLRYYIGAATMLTTLALIVCVAVSSKT